MNNRVGLDHFLGTRVFVLALGLGVFADAMLRVTPWGLNLFVVTVVVLVATGVLGRWGGVEFLGEGRWLAAPIAFFAFGLVWRDSPTLNAANWLGLLVATCLAALTARAGQIRRAGLTQYVLGVGYVVMFALAGLLPLLRWDVRVRSLGRGWWLGPSVAAGRGVLLAVAPVVVFGNLFMAADANFEHLVDDSLGAINVTESMLHVGLSLAYAWLLGGALREMLLAPLRPRAWLNGSGRTRAGALEVGVVLTLLNLLFATFVVLQVPYLFGGLAQVARLGYSEYARRGFFELVWVTGLALPTLLLTLWLVRGAAPPAERLVRGLALVLVALLYVVMASAMQRMWLYVQSYGLTELRVQASALMVWLAIVLGWFVATVLLGQRRQHFGFGALASAFVILAALDALNPDALIVRTNAHYGHLDDGPTFDARAFASFSPDATPAILEALPRLQPWVRQEAQARLDQELAGSDQDWRTFNLSRAQAALGRGRE